MKFPLLMVATLLLSPNLAKADIVHQTCRSYFGMEADIPEDARALLESGGGVTVCVLDQPPNDRYLRITSKPMLGLQGVCQFAERILSPTTSSEFPKGKPSVTYRGLAQDGQCPRQDDQRYIPTNKISEGFFLEAHRLVDRLKAGAPTSQIFISQDQALALIPKDLSQEVMGKLRERPTLYEESLQAWSRELVNPTLAAIKISDRLRAQLDGFYEIEVRDQGRNWLLAADFFDGDLKIVTIGKVDY